MDGELLFRSLSHYHQIEDGEVRGDANEGSVSFKPKGGLIGNNQTQGKSFHLPDGSSFDSSVNPEEILYPLRQRFYERRIARPLPWPRRWLEMVRKAATLCARIQAQLPSTATFRAQRVMYYAKESEIGVKYAFPDMIAFSKVAETYGWQDEYRFCFSFTDMRLEIREDVSSGDNPQPDSGCASPSSGPAESCFQAFPCCWICSATFASWSNSRRWRSGLLSL